MLRRILKKVLLAVVLLIGVLVIAYVLFNNFYPSLGGDVTKERQALRAITTVQRGHIY
ncbi:hypothetical protein ACU8V7_24660 [Zobellia nedashkovskayae]